MVFHIKSAQKVAFLSRFYYLCERKRAITAKSTFLPGLATHCRVAVIPVGKVNYEKNNGFSSSLNV